VTEYLDLGSLKDLLLKQKKFSPLQIVTIAKDIARGNVSKGYINSTCRNATSGIIL
jgi:hypothetical protein